MPHNDVCLLCVSAWFFCFVDGCNITNLIFLIFHLPSFLSPGSLTLGLVRQCQTIHGRDRTCTPPRLPGEWITVLLFIILGIISLTVTCGLVVMSHWHREASRYARWIAFTGSTYPLPQFALNQKMRSNNLFQFHLRAWLWDVFTGLWLLTAGIVKWLFPFLQMTGLYAPAKLELAEICSAAVC